MKTRIYILQVDHPVIRLQASGLTFHTQFWFSDKENDHE